MDNSNLDHRFFAIVVGSSSDDFVSYATNLLAEYGVEFVICEDVYLAAGRLARKGYGNTLVIGHISQLIREQGRLIEKISDKGFVCCCLAEGSLARRHWQISQVTEIGALVINKAAELEEILMRLLEKGPVRSSGKKKSSKAADFNRDEFACTKAERDALLGV